MTTTKQTWIEVEPTTGTLVVTDHRLQTGRPFEALNEAEKTDWTRDRLVDFRLPTPWAPTVCREGLAIRLEISGRVVRWDAPRLSGVPVVRVRVTFVGDGEPDQICSGWARIFFGADGRPTLDPNWRTA